MRENLWIRPPPDASSACLQVPKDLECCLAVGWLQTTWKLCFRGVSGDEQCMRRAKGFPCRIIDLGLDAPIETVRFRSANPRAFA